MNTLSMMFINYNVSMLTICRLTGCGNPGETTVEVKYVFIYLKYI